MIDLAKRLAAVEARHNAIDRKEISREREMVGFLRAMQRAKKK